MGEGGAWRGGLLLAAFVIIGIALFATVDDARSGTSAASDETTTTAAGDPPCGGSATVPAAVKASSVGGLSGSSALYDVTKVRVATSDPTWARFTAAAKSGQEANFQNESGVVQCTLLGWSVTDVGAQAGCDGTNPAPEAVQSELDLGCS